MNNKKKYTTNDYLKLVEDTFKVITNKLNYKHKNTGKNISHEEIKTLYNGFYLGYKILMKDNQLPKQLKIDLIAKKEIIDSYYSQDITYPNYNKVKLSKNQANRIPANLFLSNEHINNKLNRLKQLELKKKVAELNKTEETELKKLKAQLN
jgi:hypothetical protein